MNTDKWFKRGLCGLIVLILGFILGMTWTLDAAYDTGYKMAYLEMKHLLSQGSNGNQDFYISDIPYRFRPQRDRQAIQIIEIAGAGGIGRSANKK